MLGEHANAPLHANIVAELQLCYYKNVAGIHFFLFFLLRYFINSYLTSILAKQQLK